MRGSAVGVEDADVEVADEDQDAGSGVAAAQSDVVQAAVVAQGDDAGVVDAVVADPVVAGVDGGAGRDRFRSGRVGLRRCVPAKGAVRPDGVVVAAESVEQCLELADRLRSGLVVEPFLQGLVEEWSNRMPWPWQVTSSATRPPRRGKPVNTAPLSDSSLSGCPC
jgi:hypothetical protein